MNQKVRLCKNGIFKIKEVGELEHITKIFPVGRGKVISGFTKKTSKTFEKMVVSDVP